MRRFTDSVEMVAAGVNLFPGASIGVPLATGQHRVAALSCIGWADSAHRARVVEKGIGAAPGDAGPEQDSAFQRRHLPRRCHARFRPRPGAGRRLLVFAVAVSVDPDCLMIQKHRALARPFSFADNRSSI